MRLVLAREAIASLRGVAFLVGCTLISVAQASVQPSLDLGRLWAQDRFVRAMAETTGRTDREQLDLLSRAIAMTQAIKKTTEKQVEVHSLEELEQLREKILRPGLSVADDVHEALADNFPDHIVVTSPVPAVQARMEAIQNAVRGSLDVVIAFPPNAGLNARHVGFIELLLENSNDADMLVMGLGSMADAAKLQKVQQFAGQIQQHSQSIDTTLQTILNGGHFHFANPALAKATRIILSSYFRHLDEEDRRRMIFAILEQPEDMTPLAVFRRISRRASPQFQKLFQVIGREPGFAPQLSAIFQSFEEDLPAALEKDLRPAEAELRQVMDFELRALDREPVKVGSMAQMHHGLGWFTSEDHDREVAIRILKPGVHEKLARENKVLDLITADLLADPDIRSELPTLPSQVQNIKSIAVAETDLPRTFESQRRGEKIYPTTELVRLESGAPVTVRIEVPHAELIAGHSVLVQAWQPGLSLDKMRAQYPDLLRVAVEVWSRNWLKHALTEGFTHIDPHPGNLGFRVDADGNVTVIVYDFGMTTDLNAQLRQRLALFAVANHAESDIVMARVLLSLSTGTISTSPEALAGGLRDERSRLRALGKEAQLNDWIRVSMKFGLQLPDEFSSFGRGLLAISAGLRQSGSRYHVGDLVGQMIKREPAILLQFRSLTSLVSAEDFLRLSGGSLPKILGTETGMAALKSASDYLAKAGNQATNAATNGASSVTSSAKGFWRSFAQKALETLAAPPAPVVPPSPQGPVRCGGVW